MKSALKDLSYSNTMHLGHNITRTQPVIILWLDDRGVQRITAYLAEFKLNGQALVETPMLKVYIRTPTSVVYGRSEWEFRLDYTLNLDEDPTGSIKQGWHRRLPEKVNQKLKQVDDEAKDVESDADPSRITSTCFNFNPRTSGPLLPYLKGPNIYS